MVAIYKDSIDVFKIIFFYDICCIFEGISFAVLLVFHSKNFRSQKPAKEVDFNLESDSEILT